jgi:hypothetical protein
LQQPEHCVDLTNRIDQPDGAVFQLGYAAAAAHALNPMTGVASLAAAADVLKMTATTSRDLRSVVSSSFYRDRIKRGSDRFWCNRIVRYFHGHLLWKTNGNGK